MNAWQRWCGFFFLAIAAVVIQQSVWVLRLDDHGQPGSGFMPFGLGVLLAVLAIALIVKHRARDAERVRFWARRAWLQPLVAIAITAAFIVVFDDVGAMSSVVVLVTGWVWLVARKRVVVALATGLLTGAAVHLVFDRLLKTPFPRGLLF